MTRKLFAVVALTLFVLVGSQVRAGEADAKKKYKILYITQSKGFVHGSVKRPTPAQLAPSEQAMTEIGQESGLFDIECIQDASVITPEKLKDLDAVMFYTTGGLPISEENFKAFENWLKDGKAFIGVHSATDTFGTFKPYSSLINGTFNGHPWGAGTTVTITNMDPTFPAVKMFPEEFTFKDEIYQYKNYDAKAVHVLLALNMEKCSPKMPYMVPISWVREFGQGRVFYSNLGHNEGSWKDPKFREHMLMGIRWALKLEQGSAEPNPDAQAKIEAASKVAGTKAMVDEVAKAAGKDSAEVIAKFEKASAADAAFGESTAKEIEAFRKIDGKKEADKKKSEAVRIVESIEKK